MERRVVLVVLVVLLCHQSSGDKKYRLDYHYNKNTDAFYKFHIASQVQPRAKEICRAEGAQLMTWESQMDLVQAHAMMKKYPDLKNYAWIDTDSQFHESADEEAIIDLEPIREERMERYRTFKKCNVVTRDAEIQTMDCYSYCPFVCKVAAKDIYYDELCHVYGRNYIYMANISSCYKISEIAYIWNEAYAECEAQGAHLVIVNSEAEHQVLWNLIKTVPSLLEDRLEHFYAGFRANKTPDNTTREFKTIQNQTLREAGFEQWSKNANRDQDCGCLYTNDGKLKDRYCGFMYEFICEHETNT